VEIPRNSNQEIKIFQQENQKNSSIFVKNLKKLKRFGKYKNLLFEILQISQEVNPFKN
jgi:hypothetical protein